MLKRYAVFADKEHEQELGWGSFVDSFNSISEARKKLDKTPVDEKFYWEVRDLDNGTLVANECFGWTESVDPTKGKLEYDRGEIYDAVENHLYLLSDEQLALVHRMMFESEAFVESDKFHVLHVS